MEWNTFKGNKWRTEINVRDFIQENYTPYTGDESFLVEPTSATKKLWDKLSKMFLVEKEKGIYDVETKLPQALNAYGAGYIEKDLEKIVGLQTDAPLKRGIFPKGGLRTVMSSLEGYGHKLDENTVDIFKNHRKTHNDGVFSAYTDEIRACRRSGIVTGLPDAYGRGRIIGDYRRIALYGTARLIEDKKAQLKSLEVVSMDEDVIRAREEVSEQIKALNEFVKMGERYGFDLTKPAKNAQEAIQWTYFAYLGAIKDQDGAAMSLGRTATFLDIYIQRDIEAGTITEEQAQEFIDHFIMKLRIVRFLRTPGYNELFSGDPTWTTEVLGGEGVDGRTLVTKTSMRYLHTLYNLGPAPEPNLTVLWSEKSPAAWKSYCAKVSKATSALQYENDCLMRPQFGDDYAIACCVSPMKVGKQMQFFGARVNLPKTLLMAINGGRDEKSGVQVGPKISPIMSETLSFEEVYAKFDIMMDWLAQVYVQSLNIIHYMHDKYSYESFEMALHDLDVERTQAFGIAGLSIIADSLAAIKTGKVKPKRNEDGIAVDFDLTGVKYEAFGNNDDETDAMAVKVTESFMNKLRKHKTYRGARHTQSILTITSNVVYGKKTGATPDGRAAGTPFAPGANPMNGRDVKGAVSALASVAKLPFEHANDGISYTFAITPGALGRDEATQNENIVNLLDGYFTRDGGQHLNVNVFERKLLEDAMKQPEKYPQLTIRVSGYAVNFTKLTRDQQLDVISRTINTSM